MNTYQSINKVQLFFPSWSLDDCHTTDDLDPRLRGGLSVMPTCINKDLVINMPPEPTTEPFH